MAEASAETTTNGSTNVENITNGVPELDPEVKHLVCEWITDTLQTAWRQAEAERKKTIKGLFLKWHPDKNTDDPKLALEATQHIQKELERLELGLPRLRTSQFTDFSSKTSSPFTFRFQNEPNKFNPKTSDKYQGYFDDFLNDIRSKQADLDKKHDEQEKFYRFKKEERERAREQELLERERQRRMEQDRADDLARERRDELRREREEMRKARQQLFGYGPKPTTTNDKSSTSNEETTKRDSSSPAGDNTSRTSTPSRDHLSAPTTDRASSRERASPRASPSGSRDRSSPLPRSRDRSSPLPRSRDRTSPPSRESSTTTNGTTSASNRRARRAAASDAKSLTDEEMIEGLLKQSGHDIKAAENDMGETDPAYEWACFKAHQASEKAIKSLHMFRIGLKSNSHELATLAASMRDPELMDLASNVQEIIGSNNKLYNMALSEFTVIPHDDYTIEMALEAVTSAKDVLERVKALIH